MVILEDRYSNIVSGPSKCYSIARRVCRARPEGYQYMPKFKAGYWDGYITLMRGKGRIPTGLLPTVDDAWDEKGIKSAYSKQSISPILIGTGPGELKDILHGITLRDYQVAALMTLNNSSRGIIKMATGSGKTVVLAGAIQLYGIPPTLVVVRSKDLLYQTAGRLEAMLDVPVGRLGDSLREAYFDGVTVATIQTLHSLGSVVVKEAFKRNCILIVDECHMIGDNKTFDVLMSIPGWHRFGTSGTPLNRGQLNDLKLIACTGPVKVDISAAEMIETGWAAKPTIHIHEVPESTIDYWEADYHSAYDACIVENEHRNSTIEQLAQDELAEGHSVLVIVTRIAHGNLLANALGVFINDAPVLFVNGSSPMDERTQALGMLDTQPCVVIATVIFDEGVDVPGLDSIILAAGGASSIKTVQRIGRGLRPKPGRNEVRIHDFMDTANEYLLNHSEARLDTYEREQFEIVYARCVA